MRNPEYERAFREAAETLACMTTCFTDADLDVVNRIVAAWTLRADKADKAQAVAQIVQAAHV